MKKLIIPVAIFFGVFTNLNAQEKLNPEISPEIVHLSMESNAIAKSNKEMKGDKYTFRYSYDKAVKAYNRSELLTIDGQRQLAKSYSNLNKNIEAEEVYANFINISGILPEDYFNYSMILKANGKYVEAIIYMQKFSELKPNDLRAIDYKNNLYKFENLRTNDEIFKVEHLMMNTNAEDFGTTYYNEKIVFSSSRSNTKMIDRKYNWTGKPFWDLFIADVDSGELVKVQKFNSKMNSKMNDGPASFSNDGTFMAYTKNHSKDKSKDKVVELQIYFSTLVGKKWSKPEPFVLNNKDFSVGHPCLSADGNTMYFTSDMAGGYGGADIYKITKNANGEWQNPENLGNNINTESDELFPFFEENNKILFFSSNGRFGLGGLDIFMAKFDENSFGKTFNAGSPVNTKSDDFAIIVNNKMNKGYLSSNRIDGSGGDDIYYFDMLKGLYLGKKINGIAKDKDNNPIPNTFITLSSENGNLIDSMTTKDDAAYTFFVDSDKEYKLVGEKETYIEGDSIFDTFGSEYTITADVILLQKEEPITEIVAEKVADFKTNVVNELVKVFGLNLDNVYFDFGKYNIRPDAEIELNKIVKTMNKYPTMVVELASYTDCRSNEGFNQNLSDKRAKASVNFIKSKISNPDRISGKGYGETNLVNKCACSENIPSECSEQEHQKNRRTEFVIVKE
ncbi:MAG: hypothetical protein A2W98_13290 [Bacteroidetes bacterium GWF2_33_38]|nr:MAG: hypothetical protein A2W98_13290 [Bacteroidetes bacterium GWF2_33_38]